MESILENIEQGNADAREIPMLEEISRSIEGHTICALGDAAAWPVQGTYGTRTVVGCCTAVVCLFPDLYVLLSGAVHGDAVLTRSPFSAERPISC